ncbi:MAG: DmsC/YnfH family molybdoenzyme membrane anchor subunit [Opitutales bacterium]
MAVEPEQAQFYKSLIPLSKPGEGEQYAFKVDLDKCTGCKACVSACHSLNGLDDHETWRDVGTIHGFDDQGSYTQTVTTACHHCVDPGCLNGCPVLAYEKDDVTGVVYHLDDQCIGCQYCVLKCPYDVPKYSDSLGIVRKCDMCHGRLAEGEAPACVQACPTEAISITIVNTEEAVQAARATGGFLAGAPEPSYTVPTTQYVTERCIPENTVAADENALRPEHAHLPLVFMLVLTQFSVGLFSIEYLFAESALAKYIAFSAMSLGLVSSVLHLGRPLGAWRAFLGLRRSWLSREIVTFGAFSVFSGAYTCGIVPQLTGLLTLLSGIAGVFTSVMIYHDTLRPFWAFPYSGLRFYGATFGLGMAAYAALVIDASGWITFTAVAVFVAKAAVEVTQLRASSQREYSPAKKSALLMQMPLKSITLLRFSLLGAGLLFSLVPVAFLAIIGLGLLLLSELFERVLFFKAVAAPKMPGGVYT